MISRMRAAPSEEKCVQLEVGLVIFYVLSNSNRAIRLLSKHRSLYRYSLNSCPDCMKLGFFQGLVNFQCVVKGGVTIFFTLGKRLV